MHGFKRRLGEAPLLCDGAMGTVLYARGAPLDGCFDVLNLTQLRTWSLMEVLYPLSLTANAAAVTTAWLLGSARRTPA